MLKAMLDIFHMILMMVLNKTMRIKLITMIQFWTPCMSGSRRCS